MQIQAVGDDDREALRLLVLEGAGLVLAVLLYCIPPVGDPGLELCVVGKDVAPDKIAFIGFCKLGEVVGDGGVEIELAFTSEFHQRGGDGGYLGDGGEVVDVVMAYGSDGVVGVVAISFVKRDLVVVDYDDLHAGEGALLNGVVGN